METFMKPVGRGRCRTIVFRMDPPGRSTESSSYDRDESSASAPIEDCAGQVSDAKDECQKLNDENLCQQFSDVAVQDKSSASGTCGIVPALFITRPAHIHDKTGTSGQHIICYTNFIPIDNVPEWNMYQYHLSFSPVVDSKSFRIDMIRHKSFAHIFGDDPVCDGMIFYSPRRLEEDRFELTCNHPKTNDPVTIHLKLTNVLNLDHQQCLTVFNLCAKKSFEALGYKQIGRHYYNPLGSKKIEKHRLEIWPGIVAAIRVYEEKLLLCCETSFKVLRMDTVASFMLQLLRLHGPQQFKEKVMESLLGTSVLTRYNNKTYKVDDIMWDLHPTDSFTLSDGRSITYIDYYSEQFGLKINDAKQPLLISRSKKHGGLGQLAALPDICLIPELCYMTGLTNEMREDTRVMRDLAEHTRVSPEIRATNARRYLRDISENAAARQVFQTWNLSIANELQSVDARVLPRETILFGDNQKCDYTSATADWSRECRARHLTDAVPLDQWAMVFHAAQRQQAKILYEEIARQGPSMKMSVTPPTTVELDSDRNTVHDYLQGIKSAREAAPRARIIVIVVPNDNETRYTAIKKWCCLDFPIPSQVVRCTSLDKNTQSVCSKILLQMNCKMGGSIWRVHIPLKMSMVIGYDLYHDSANKTQTVGAAVFSVNQEMTRWYSRCAIHNDPKQLTTNLKEFCRQGLRKFYDINGNFPSRVFLYRDGVGEGQIPVVFREELPEIRKAFVEAQAEIKLCFLIVTKSVTLRFFEKKQNSFANPPPGTVVDNRITKPERYDFYMVPQAVRQGTVSPVSYNVIFDDTLLTPDQLQRLTYKMCHMYYNWQGTIRVPAPCQYAHKLAFLVAQNLHKPMHESLADRLFFL